MTQANGFLLNFTVAMRYSSVDKPEDYSHDKVLELMEEYPAVEGDGSVTQPVNIIAIMNESFADMTIFENLAVSDDPTPFFHSLEENTVKGWMYSPVTGGGTAAWSLSISPASPLSSSRPTRGLSALHRGGHALPGRPGGQPGI